MTITRADVADLRKGDVVRVTGWYGVNLLGPLSEGTKSLWLGQHVLVRDVDGSVGHWAKPDSTLTVVSRAPRLLYINHDRTEPVPGDVVRGDGMDSAETWAYFAPDGAWAVVRTCAFADRRTMPARLRLLVDGETGQVVP